MKVKRGKVSDFGQRSEVERLVQMPVDVGDYSVHSALVFRAAGLRSHAGW